MTRDEVIRIAREVYGQDTDWRGTPLARLELLAEKLIQAHTQATPAQCPACQGVVAPGRRRNARKAP